MNLLFTRKYKYTKYDSIENVREQIKSITKRKWYDSSDNIAGKIKEDNSFQFTHKWSFSFIRWIESSSAYINGQLKSEDNKTTIQIRLRPNSSFVLTFYILVLFSLYNLFQPSTFTDEDEILKLLFIAFFCLFLYVLMMLFTSGLRKNFERALHLQLIE
jgi:hypothetical protein